MKSVLSLAALVLLVSCSETKPYYEPPTKSYPDILEGLALQKEAFKKEFKNANAEEKKIVIQKVKKYLFHQLTKEIFPSWYGTNWDFNGTIQTPKEGDIACGYFVTTTLEDLGFNIPRIKWAQAASEQMIVAATDEVKRFSGVSMYAVNEWLKTKTNTIYIVGLYNHAGFVYHNGTDILFVHSSPFNDAHGVLAEPVMTRSPLTVSKYRVFGEILNEPMVVAWLEDKQYN